MSSVFFRNRFKEGLERNVWFSQLCIEEEASGRCVSKWTLSNQSNTHWVCCTLQQFISIPCTCMTLFYLISFILYFSCRIKYLKRIFLDWNQANPYILRSIIFRSTSRNEWKLYNNIFLYTKTKMSIKWWSTGTLWAWFYV